MSNRVACCFCTLCFFIPFGIWFTFLVMGYALYPSDAKFYIENTSLTEFDFNNTTKTLNYNLNLNVSLRNPNKKSQMCYNKIRVEVFYKKKSLGKVPFTRFCQGHKNTSFIYPVFVGQSVLRIKDSQVAEYSREKAEGFFPINVEVYLRIRNKVGSFKTAPSFPNIGCNLKIPVIPTNISTGAVFTRASATSSIPKLMANLSRYL